ncbi:hypothetical protein Pmar_PMAR019655 [Perkinsus marinus ATCC 50983]|uniref:Uncharacterized protein n=1 Tax=Perkinsus marinus (strain ATCC 50983 / TXsc) TaxID=423536 RepID=C5LFA6_PERM5|nr:hypothetical protein Pmar_PMAR019655 [Perkinsus marinus ATCC 50983]EER04621.1 hypothetical protein Pmar_PMAR019655 [Perkinsus marinus ATCC 50983]|eukprot:XP_002772805.1 hypothetical protein Pmar_PMAR019655 [Perkinsus marinus ATCC 50983]
MKQPAESSPTPTPATTAAFTPEPRPTPIDLVALSKGEREELVIAETPEAAHSTTVTLHMEGEVEGSPVALTTEQATSKVEEAHVAFTTKVATLETEGSAVDLTTEQKPPVTRNASPEVADKQVTEIIVEVEKDTMKEASTKTAAVSSEQTERLMEALEHTEEGG